MTNFFFGMIEYKEASKTLLTATNWEKFNAVVLNLPYASNLQGVPFFTKSLDREFPN